MGRKGEESREGSEQTPHKACDMQLENSSKICFPAASPKSTPFAQCCLSLESSFMSHLYILGQVWPITALIPQLNQPRVSFPPESGSLLSHVFATPPGSLHSPTSDWIHTEEPRGQAAPSLRDTGNTFQLHSEHTACLAQPVPMARVCWDLPHTLDMEENAKQVSSSPEKC